jgi:hypothetical protein
VVDVRSNRTCPYCSAPLNEVAPVVSPPAQAPSAPGRANVRVSLTGEALEDAPGASASGPYANAQPGLPPGSVGRPVLSGSARPAATPYARREAAPPDNSRRNALLINLSVMVVFLLLCGGGGAWYWAHRTNPKAQVTRYLHAVQWLDWGVVYDLSATPPGDKTRHEFIGMMDDKFDNNGLLKVVARHRMEKITFEVGEPTIQGDEATVPVTRKATPLDPAKSMPLTLTNKGGIWKIHPLAVNPLDLLHDPDEDKAIGGGLPALTPGPDGTPILR